MSEYVWAAGCRILKRDADPQVVGDVLDHLQLENGGRLTPRVVVDTARPSKSALHDLFEWDDMRAAELFREEQARHVIRSIRIVQPGAEADAPKTTIHAYVSLVEEVEGETQSAYVPIARLSREPMLLQQAIDQALKDLRSFEERYREFEVIARAVRQVREELTTARRQAS